MDTETLPSLPPFHLAIPVHDITVATDFYVRFEGEPGEQWTMFFYDPSGNAVEFKAFADLNQLFAV